MAIGIARLPCGLRDAMGLRVFLKFFCHVLRLCCDQVDDGTAYRSVANRKGVIMKSLLITTVLVATSFAASAMNYGIDNSYTANTSTHAKTRAEVMAELQEAKANGSSAVTESEIRRAEAQYFRSPSTLTREQVQQEVVALSNEGLLLQQGRR